MNNESNKGKFDNINFTGMEIDEILSLCLKCENKEDAEKVLQQYEKYCETPQIARRNLGYIFGYLNPDKRKIVYSLFPVDHPIFGPAFGRDDCLTDDVIINRLREFFGTKFDEI